MAVIVIVNVIIGLIVSYLCAKGLGFGFSLWTMSVDFIVCGIILALSSIPVRDHFNEASTLLFLASLMAGVGIITLIIALVVKVPRQYGKSALRELGIILELAGIIVFITLWDRPIEISSLIIPEVSVLIGLWLLVENRK